MEVDRYVFMTDAVTKFYNTVRIYGWFHHPTDQLIGVELVDDQLIHAITRVGLEHGGVRNLGDNKGFEIQALRKVEEVSENIRIAFHTQAGKRLLVSLHELCKDRIAAYPGSSLDRRFREEAQRNNWSILNVGGRFRSGVDRSAGFKVSNYVVLDILAGENVDVVGDAHNLSALFPPDRFDAFYSVSVFEHLMMPWAVVPQLNRVLKTGGVGLISTHQTLGMHDMPWDFWRFSDTAWDALFNRHTGFEVVETALDFEQQILPFVYRPSKHHAERSAGFERSAVWVRKIGPCNMKWDLTPADVAGTRYPEGDDGFVPDDFGGPVV